MLKVVFSVILLVNLNLLVCLYLVGVLSADDLLGCFVREHNLPYFLFARVLYLHLYLAATPLITNNAFFEAES